MPAVGVHGCPHAHRPVSELTLFSETRSDQKCIDGVAHPETAPVRQNAYSAVRFNGQVLRAGKDFKGVAPIGRVANGRHRPPGGRKHFGRTSHTEDIDERIC